MPEFMLPSSENITGRINSAPRPPASGPWTMENSYNRDDIGASATNPYLKYAKVGKLSPGTIPEGQSPLPNGTPIPGGFTFDNFDSSDINQRPNDTF